MADTMSSMLAVGGSDNVTDPPELPFLSAVELTVFQTAVKNYKIHGEFLRDDAIALHWVFGPSILTVLQMLDEDFVTIMKSVTSKKVIVRVYGRSGEVYWVPPGTSICQCRAYLHSKREYCKHILAAHFLLAITPPEEYEDISDRELVQIFNECFKDRVN